MARRLWAKMLRLTGRLGDGWTSSYGYAPPEQIPRMQHTIDQSVAAAERKTKEVRRNYNLAGIILESDTKKAGQQQGRITMNDEEDRILVGSVNFWIDTIAKFYKNLQMDSFTFWPANESSEQVSFLQRRLSRKSKKVLREKEKYSTRVPMFHCDANVVKVFLLLIIIITISKKNGQSCL
jgi:alkanesulfonate monooxygenase SsuD/methylene tetrahydromethanopterin reductase-like flavin-dependent oxidoreductase (luciferase family)